ncbi:nuclear transport factor 2 family protein [Xylophilus sp. Kf1]|nr:nuclear transport factor 2 family protein [Xylophilus sp. Kf1]
MHPDAQIAELQRQLRRLQAEAPIRACVSRYMALCDRLDADTPLAELAGLFTADATWEGRGARYAGSFGGYRGREAIAAMFATYMRSPPHFALNVHFLCSETIAVAADAQSADAGWVMLQTSTFATGESHLNAARLTLKLRHEDDGAWRIALFQTENLFSRPTGPWNDTAPLPVPDQAPLYLSGTSDQNS